MNGPSRHRSAGVIAGVALLAMGGTGLAGHGADKTGSDTVVLHLATIDGSVNANGQEYGPQAFVDSLDSVSGGRLQVDVSTAYGDGAADAESRLVEAIASGDLDGGWPSTRAFAGAGIDGLQAIEAPMTITSYAAEKALVTSPIADTVREQLDGSGRGRARPRGRSAAPPVRRRGTTARAGGLAGRTVPGLQLAGPGGCRHRARRRAGQPRLRLDRRGQRGHVPRRRVRHRPVLRQRPDDRGRVRHGQRRAVAEGVRAGHEPGALRRPHRRAARLGHAGGRAGDPGLRRRRLRRDDARPRALRQGCPLRLRRRRGDRRTARCGRTRRRPAGRRSARGAAARRRPRARRADIPIRTCPTCRPAASRPDRRPPMPPRSRTSDPRYPTAPTGWRSRRAMASGRAQQPRGMGRHLDARDQGRDLCRHVSTARRCATELRREQRLRGGARGRRPPRDRQHRLLRLRPRAVGAADRLPAAGVERHRPLLGRTRRTR